jgi:vacuolar iron transporter family protein
MVDDSTKRAVLAFQRNEITEHNIYKRLSELEKDPKNKETLSHISGDELRHYNYWKGMSHEDVKPDMMKARHFIMICRALGITFGIKLMEKGEGAAKHNYSAFGKKAPKAIAIAHDEERHEKELIGMIDEERLKYVGSVVLGLNDALVEFTGALAGFTFALQNSRLIAMTGMITGIAASLSMSASEYLSTKTEIGEKKPLKAAVYTGITYLGTVFLMVLPYILLKNMYIALGITLAVVVSLIALFTFYISVAKDLPFKKRFIEMCAISLGVAAISFCLGFVVKLVFGVTI